MTINELKISEYHNYYQPYLDKIEKGTELLDGYKTDQMLVNQFFVNVPKDKLLFRYAEDKWSIKEIFQHLIDAERIFLHRCFRIARYDSTELPGFDQDDYIVPSGADGKSLNFLLDEFNFTRQHSIILLKSLKKEDLANMGNANGSTLSARAAAFINLGHYIWHMNVIKERYLN